MTTHRIAQETKEVLGVLDGSPAGVAELMISTLGYWERIALVEEGLIMPFEQQTGTGTSEAMEAPAEVVITRAGIKAIDRYAIEFGGHVDARENAARLRREYEEYLASRS